MLQSDDIAWILTHISVYNNYIPTGAPSSQLVAFWAYYECFDEIVKVGEHFGIKASLYVDDITFSSQTQISTDFIFRVTKILKKYNLSVKKKKTKYYGKKDNKLITGVIITPQHEIRIPNKLRQKIITTADSLFSSTELDITTFNSLFGMLKSARQIEKNAFDNLYNRMIKINKRISTQ